MSRVWLRKLRLDDFEFIWGPPGDPKIDPKLIPFLMRFRDIIFQGCGLLSDPPDSSKKGSKRGPNRISKIIDFAAIYYTSATSRGPENHHFGHLFGTHFWMLFRNLFLIDFEPFGGPSGDPMGTPKGTLKNTSKKDPPKKPVLAREREARSNARSLSQPHFE